MCCLGKFTYMCQVGSLKKGEWSPLHPHHILPTNNIAYAAEASPHRVTLLIASRAHRAKCTFFICIFRCSHIPLWFLFYH